MCPVGGVMSLFHQPGGAQARVSNLAANSWLTFWLYLILKTPFSRRFSCLIHCWWIDELTARRIVISGPRTYPNRTWSLRLFNKISSWLRNRSIFWPLQLNDQILMQVFREVLCVLERFLWLVSSFNSAGIFVVCAVCERGGSFVRETSRRGAEMVAVRSIPPHNPPLLRTRGGPPPRYAPPALRIQWPG